MRAFPDLPGGRRSEFIDCPRGTSVELDSLRPGLIVPFFETPLVGIERVPSAPTSCLLVLHGLAEHCGRYASTMESLAVSGIACFAYDQRGHGRSPGRRGDIQRFSEFADDFRTIRAGIAHRYPGLPTFAWGHSLGAIVVILAALDPSNALTGAITTGCPTCAMPPFPLPVWQRVRIVAGALPTIRVRPGLRVEALTHVVTVQQDYLRDPLVQKKASIRLLVELGRASTYALREAPAIRTPWLALHGGEDTIAPPQGSKALVERLGSADKQLLVYPGLRHEVHNEAQPAAMRFRQQIAAWTNERSTTQRAEN